MRVLAFQNLGLQMSLHVAPHGRTGCSYLSLRTRPWVVQPVMDFPWVGFPISGSSSLGWFPGRQMCMGRVLSLGFLVPLLDGIGQGTGEETPCRKMARDTAFRQDGGRNWRGAHLSLQLELARPKLEDCTEVRSWRLYYS